MGGIILKPTNGAQKDTEMAQSIITESISDGHNKAIVYVVTGTFQAYLSGMTYEDMAGGEAFSAPDDDRRYQF